MPADPANFPRRRDLRGGAPETDGSGARGGVAALEREAEPPPSVMRAPMAGSHGERRALVPGSRPSPPPAGRHATDVGDGFTRLVAFTILGAIIPGAGLVLAGRRRLGWVVIGLVMLVLGGGAALVASDRAVPLALRVGTDAGAVIAVAGLIVLGAVIWCVVILASHVALRQNLLTRSQRVLAAVLVMALMGIVSLPAATAARFALSQRSVLNSVFGDDGGNRDGLANPDLAAADPWAGTPRINVLMLGSDAGADRKGIRPDTIFVASIDTRTGDTVLFNLPRNLRFAPFPPGSPGARAFPEGFTCGTSATTDACILNAVWQWGEEHPEAFPGATEPGLAATRDVVGQVLGLVIDYDMVVNLRGFEEVVDAMGGLVIDVERDIPIGGGDRINAAGRVIGKNPVTGVIEQGPNQLLTGNEALWYARSREGSNDYDRMRRQRCTIGAAVEQFDVVTLAQAFPAIAASAERNIETDISARQLPAFVELGQRVQAGSLRSLAFTDDVVDTTDPDYVAIRRLVQQALMPPPPAPTSTASASPAPTASGSPSAPSPSASASAGAPAAPQAPAPSPGQAVDTDDVCGA